MPVELLDRRALLRAAGFVAVTAFALVYQLRGLDLDKVMGDFQAVRWTVFLFALLPLAGGMLIMPVRWRLVLGRRISYRQYFNAVNAGFLVNSLVPLKLGEVIKTLLLQRSSGLPGAQIASSLVTERLIDYLLRIGVGLFALTLGFGDAPARHFLLQALPVVILLFALLWLIAAADRQAWFGSRAPDAAGSKLRALLVDLHAGYAGLKSVERLGQLAAWSVLSMLLFGAANALVMYSVDPGPVDLAWWAFSLGVLALAPPSDPGPPVFFQTWLVLQLHLFGYQQNKLLVLASLINLLHIAWVIPVGTAGLLAGRRFLRPEDQGDE